MRASAMVKLLAAGAICTRRTAPGSVRRIRAAPPPVPAGKACSVPAAQRALPSRRASAPWRQPLAAAQLGPVATEMVRGTLRSAAPVRADSVRRRTSSSSPAATSTMTSSWTWSTRRLASASLLEVAVEAHQGQLEDVGRQPLDAGVHGLALGRLAQPVVRRVQVGQRPDPAELGAGGAPDLGVGHRLGPCTASPAGRRRSSSP